MTKNNIEYEEAPSGFVTFYNYKEPLMKFTGGFGFMGALVFDGETDKIQCHFCGEWFGSLAPHLHREHNMNVSAYKEKVGLLQTTALISESLRSKLIANGLDKRLQNLRKGGKMKQEQKEKIRATLKSNSEKMEFKNLRGTCPEQLIYRLQEVYKREGANMSFKKHVHFDDNLIRTFGSVKEACRMADVPYREPGQTIKSTKKYGRLDAVAFIKEFILCFKRTPNREDFIQQGKKGLYQSYVKHADSLLELIKEAYSSFEEYKKADVVVNFPKEKLLEFLRNFEKINGRKPAISDGKRGLIPYPSRYYHHFGSWEEAMKLAFKENE